MRRIVDGYLESLLRRNASAAALAPQFRASVNGTWVTAETMPAIDDFPALQMFIDDEQHGAVLAGVAIAEGARRPFVLRLKIQSARILEAECIFSHAVKGHFADVDQLLKPDVLYDAPVPAERASDREGLESAANSYWTGLQESDGSIPRRKSPRRCTTRSSRSP